MTKPPLTSISAKKIIILRALFLGDLLCSVPAFRALRHRFPEAELTLIGLPWAQDLVNRSPYLDLLLPSPGFDSLPEVPYDAERTAAFFAAQREAGYDLAIQLHGSGRNSNTIVAALGARHSIGFGVHADERMTATVPWVEEQNEIIRCLQPIALLGADTSGTRIDFPIFSDEYQHAQALLNDLPRGGPIIGMHPGAKDPRRRWPVEHFATLGDALVSRCNARVVLTGGPEDRPLGELIRHSMCAPVLDLTGQTDLGTAAAVISHLDLLVTNDTGASHLAAATCTPSVVLFGHARPERWAPLNRSLHTVIDSVTFDGKHHDPESAIFELPVSDVLVACERKLVKSLRSRMSRPELAVTFSRERDVRT
jgi:ADP-heptose:LPS heptosyltransferase